MKVGKVLRNGAIVLGAGLLIAQVVGIDKTNPPATAAHAGRLGQVSP